MRFEVCSMLCVRNINDPFIDRIVTCNKTIDFYNNHKQSGQWLDCDGSPKQFPKPKFHQHKIIVPVWCSAIGVIHYRFLETNQNITAEIYSNQLADMYTSCISSVFYRTLANWLSFVEALKHIFKLEKLSNLKKMWNLDFIAVQGLYFN